MSNNIQRSNAYKKKVAYVGAVKMRRPPNTYYVPYNSEHFVFEQKYNVYIANYVLCEKLAFKIYLLCIFKW